jgi:hypothetical protein
LRNVGAGMELDALSNLGRRADQLLLPCIEFVVVLINVIIVVVLTIVLIIILVIIFLIAIAIVLLRLIVVATGLAAPPFAPFATTLVLTAGCIDS